MPVPETTVDEYSDSVFRENEVWLTEYLRVSPPAADAMRTEEHDHPQFRILVTAPSDERHHGAALRGREDVRHQCNRTAARPGPAKAAARVSAEVQRDQAEI
jgi:hypothetical protein